MKILNFLFLSVLFVTGTLFAMEDQEASFSNLTFQDELWAGIEENNPEKVRIALGNGADPNEFRINESRGYYRPLFKAIDNFYQNGTDNSLLIVRYLLENGADPDNVEIRSFKKNMVDCPVLFRAIRNPKESMRLAFPLVKLIYDFIDNPYKPMCYHSTDDSVYELKEVIKSYFKFILDYSNLLNSKSKLEEITNEKDNWARIALLIVPEIIEDEEFSSEYEFLKQIQHQVNALNDIKESYGSIHNYVQKRPLGMPFRNNKIYSTKTFSETNDLNNNNGKKKE